MHEEENTKATLFIVTFFLIGLGTVLGFGLYGLHTLLRFLF